MIGFLRGEVQHLESEVLLICGGVGYQVTVTPILKSQLGATAELYIYTHVREDKLELFGFQSPAQKTLFELLLSVSGVGPSTALALTNQPAEKIEKAVQNAEVAFFTAIPRVGKKLAQKIIIELRGKLGELHSLDLTPLSAKGQQVQDALTSLGFAEPEIQTALEQIDVDALDLEVAIKATLQQLKKPS